ncbi:MAG: radical SAM protein [Candidatus Omnitrophica bacterium]|nr:radical SAM protein [Candidatus Omnitrophota bacterium]
MKEYPRLLAVDQQRRIVEAPGFQACGLAGEQVSVLRPADLVPLPAAGRLFVLPLRTPVGFDRRRGVFEEIADVNAVAALVPPGYTQLYCAAYRQQPQAQTLPLFSYAPVAWYRGGYAVPAVRVDRRGVHDTGQISPAMIRRAVRPYRATPNRLLRRLQQCALSSRCANAINFFVGRYECPLPVSPACNARCAGCISFQPAYSPPASQQRICFVPDPEEVAEIALAHIQRVRRPMVSFGQGCEGEPLLQAEVIAAAIRLIRARTAKGTIHLNTNGSLPAAIARLCRSGLNSIRVSLNSCQADWYRRYYRPQGYTFADVRATIAVAKRYNLFISLNYLVMPGVTDHPREWARLRQLLRSAKPDMIQWRNLNIDPQQYYRIIGAEAERLLGVRTVIENVSREFPGIRQGYFNVPKECFRHTRPAPGMILNGGG